MAKKVTNKQLVDNNLFVPAKENTDAWIKSLEVLENQLKDIAKIQGNILKTANAAQAKGIRDITNASKNLLQVEKEVARVAQQKERLKQQELRTQQQVERTTQAQIRTTEAQVRQQKRLERESKQLNSVYAQQSKNLNDLRRRYKDLALQNRENTREGQKLLRNITVLDARLKSIDRTVGQNQREVGNYSSAFRNLGSQLGGFIGVAGGVVGAVAAIGAGIKASIGLFSEFGLAIAKVNAVSGANAQEQENLTNLAKELGQTTQFTASQVAGLELELSKLGFDPSEIEAATESVLNFAIATDSDLARSGEVVAATLNAFQLEAGEAGRVADVAAKAFSSSALDIEKFSTAISAVGPAANAVDVSLERTTAILGKIVDSGIDASTAGTALRNVFIDLADKGITFEDALTKINSSQDSLSAANELFGKRGAVVAQVIANNAEGINELDESLQNAEGSAAAAAETIGDTLDGDIKKLQSAIEGAILDGEGFEGLFRRVVQFLTKALPPVINFFGGLFDVIQSIGTIIGPVVNGLFEINKGLISLFTTQQKVVDEQEQFVKGLESERSALINIKAQLEDNNTSQEQRNNLIEFVNREYKDYLPNLISEEDSYEDIAKAIDTASAALLKRQILIREEEKIAEAIKAQVETVEDLSKAQIEAQEEVDRLTKAFLAIDGANLNDLDEITQSIESNVVDLSAGIDELGEVTDEYGKTLDNSLSSQAIQDLNNQVLSLGDGIQQTNNFQKSFADLNQGELRDAAVNLKNALEDLEEANANLNFVRTADVASSITKEYDLLLERFGLLRDAADDLADSNDNLTDSQDKQNESSKESIVLKEQQIALSKELLDIETRLNEDITAVLQDRTLSAEQQQAKITELQEQAAKDRAEAELVNLQQTNSKILELEEFNQQAQLDRAKDIQERLTELELEGLEDRLEENRIKQKQLEELEEFGAKKREQQRQQELEDVQQALELTGNFIDAFNKKRLSDLDEQEKQINQRQEELRARFEAGNDAAGDSLAELDKRQAELRKERERELERQKRTELGLAALNAYTANLQQNPETALQDTFRDVLALSTFLTGLSFGPAFHGADDTGKSNGLRDQYGGITGWHHEHEQVWSQKDRNDVGWRNRDEIKSIVHEWENMNMTDFDTVPIPVSRSNDNRKIIQKFDELKKEVSNLKNHMPQTKWSYDEMGKAAVEEVRSKSKVERNHYKIKGIWGGK